MDDFERDLERRFNSLDVPPSAEEARLAAVENGFVQRERRRRRRRRSLVIVVAVAVAAGAVSAAIALTREESGRTVPKGPAGASEGRAESPYLQGLPWLWQPNGTRVVTDTPTGTRGLAFPASMSYRDAATALYRSVTETGTLPKSSRVVNPPPRGVVVKRLADGRVVVNLAAPFGYEPQSGITRTPRLQFPASMSLEEAIALQKKIASGPAGTPWPKGVTLVWPTPPKCQVLPRAQKVAECAFIRRASD